MSPDKMPQRAPPKAFGVDTLNDCIDNMSDALLLTAPHPEFQPEHQVLWANKAFFSLTGYSADETIGASSSILQGPQEGRSILKQLTSGRRAGEGCREELALFQKDGSTIWADFVVTPISDDKGQCTHWVWVIREVKEGCPEEARRRKSEERYRLAVQGANIGIWDWDIAHDEIYFSPIWKTMLGYEEHEIQNEFSEWLRLLHPDDIQKARSRVQDFLDKKIDRYEIEFRLRHKNGGYVDILSLALAVEGGEGDITRLVGIHVDVTARRRAEKKLRYQSTHDDLTGLVNRVDFERRVNEAISGSSEYHHSYALCYLDLDQFKLVNDTCGHVAGDELLRELGGIMSTVIRKSDTLARLGGDEFGILIQAGSLDEACRVASEIQEAIKDFTFMWEGNNFRISASMGLVSISGPESTVTQLLKDADAACFLAKDLGRDRIQVHQEDDTVLAERHGEMQWVNQIQAALDDDRFVLYCQAIQPLAANDTSRHYEVLIRMLDVDGNTVSPGVFMPAAERYSQIVQIDRWVLENVFRVLSDNPKFLSDIDFISINISGPSLSDAAFLRFVENQFRKHNISGRKICFEITETAAITHRAMADSFLENLTRIGCRFSLDDFGSGLSSYGYLKTLPVDFLKIDGMFITDIVDDRIDFEIVKSIKQVGHAMGMKTIAEFVETKHVARVLEELGIDFAQGFGIHEPQPMEKVIESVR